MHGNVISLETCVLHREMLTGSFPVMFSVKLTKRTHTRTRAHIQL